MILTPHIIELGKKYETPFLLFDLEKIKENYKAIKQSITDVEIFYAIKANDHPEIITTLNEIGSSFEISSLNEMRFLLQLHVDPSKIICLNSIKSPEFLTEMAKNNIQIMAFDSTDEIDKIVKYAPNSNVILRIAVSNQDSDWPLTKKFGVDAADALFLLQYAKAHNIKPLGLTFHVGSQCLNKNNWANALYVCDEIWKQAKAAGIDLSFISLGGGLPVQHIKKIPSVNEIGEIITTTLSLNFKNNNTKTRITIEPGRGLVGDAAIMASTVVGKAKRGTEEWIYIDVGVFNGLMETIENFAYELKTEIDGERKTVTIAGPSCDSVDIPFKDVQLPQVKIGDRVYIINAGAYTTVYAANFNGFAVPKVYFLTNK